MRKRITRTSRSIAALIIASGCALLSVSSLANGQQRSEMHAKEGALRGAATENRCREIRTATQIGLTNGLVSLRFDRNTGALVSLRNDVCRDEYLKPPGREGNPFRVYLDTTEPPPPAIDSGWWGGKIEGTLGGRLAEAADCRLVSASGGGD